MAKHKWDAIISDLESSGLNPNQYATRHQISKTSLYYHLRKRRETAKQSVEPRGLAHEVKLSELKVYTKPNTLKLSLGVLTSPLVSSLTHSGSRPSSKR